MDDNWRADRRDCNNLITKWSGKNKPAVEIDSGDIITFEIPDSSTDQIKPGATMTSISGRDGSLTDAAVGPVFVRGCLPSSPL